MVAGRVHLPMRLVLVLALAIVAGCLAPGTGSVTTHAVALQGATHVDARIEQGAGRLTIASGAPDLLDATVRANDDRLRPAVAYEVKDGVGSLRVSQSAEPVFVGPRALVNDWDLRFASGIPMTLDVEHGAGDTNVTLAGLGVSDVTIRGGAGTTSLDARDAASLVSFGVFTGAGSATIDARGAWTHNVTGSISSGAGSLTVRVPDDTPVRIVAHAGVGGVRATGLSQQGSVFTNVGAVPEGPMLRLDVSAGAGAVVLDAS